MSESLIPGIYHSEIVILICFGYIEDLTRVVISYEIY